VDLNVTVPQEVVHDFLKRHSAWDGDEEATPYLYLSSEDTRYEAEAHLLAEDAILVGVPLQNFLVAMTKPNNDPYEVWFALIKNKAGIWEQGKHSKVVTFKKAWN
jgi:hypothetical protein